MFVTRRPGDRDRSVRGRQGAAGVKARPAGRETLTRRHGGGGGRLEALEGRTLLSAIHGVVFLDGNASGQRDPGEPGLGGWQVYIDANRSGAREDGERTATTDANGVYVFRELTAGTYRVRETPRAGYTQTAPPNGYHDVVLGERQEQRADFGNRPNENTPGNIRGVVFEDLDGDGFRDSNEPGLGGRVVFLDTDRDGVREDGERAATSIADGRYAFEGLPPGAYRVREVVPEGWRVTRPLDGFYDINLAPGQNANELFFGNRRLEEPRTGIAGHVYNDLDGDGAREAGEGPLAGWRLFLDTDGDQVFDEGEPTTVSNPSGFYSFSNLAPGTYRLREVVQPGWTLTQPSGGLYEVTLAQGQIAERHFGNHRQESTLGQIRGSVFHDLDGDGTRDDGEPPLAGWMLYLDTDRDGTPDEGERRAVANWDGRYAFEDLAPGEYRVAEIVPAGWRITAPAAGYYDVTLAAGQRVVDRDFGNRRVEEPNRTGIVGHVYNDLDGDGTRDSGEPPLAGWQVFIDLDTDGTRDDGEPATASNAQGFYGFSGLAAGTYQVREVVQTGWTATQPAGGVYEVTLAAGQVAERHFGNQRNAAEFGHIRGGVFYDYDGDGTRDAGEPGLGGRVVYLDADRDGTLDADERRATTQADGRYAFENVTPGEYRVAEVLPEGWRITAPQAGYYDVTVVAGQTVYDRHFGNRRLEEPTRPVSIRGNVFQDVDGDGVRDYGERGMSGWTVYLDTDRDGTLDEGEPRRLSGTDGRYVFEGLAPGSYRVAEVVRPEWRLTGPPEGYYDVTLASGESADRRHFGNRRVVQPPAPATIRGLVFNDLDGDGTRDDGEAGLGGRIIFLDTDRDGTRDDGERFAVSSPEGRYAFEGLAPGEYRVAEVLPAGWRITAPAEGYYTVVLAAGQTAFDRHFGNRQTEPPPGTGSIAGVVFNDLDADGVRDTGEAGIAGVRVYLDTNNNRRPDTGERTTVTGDTGAYAFNNLAAGVYRVRQFVSEGTRVTTPPEGVHVIELDAGEGTTGADFGDTRRSRIQGAVFHDVNGDGFPQRDEPALAGWTVFLDTDRDGSPDKGEPSVETDAEGRYAFDVDAGSYRVREVVPADWRPTRGAFGDVNLGSGQVFTRHFFNTQRALVAGRVFNDADGDGTADEGEPGIGGRRVYLDADDDGVFDQGERSTLTDPRGGWRFDGLEAGPHVIRVLGADGWDTTTPEGGAHRLNLAGGQIVEGLLFGQRRIEGEVAKV